MIFSSQAVDIGMATTRAFNEIIKNSATVVWFGSIGDTKENFTRVCTL